MDFIAANPLGRSLYGPLLTDRIRHANSAVVAASTQSGGLESALLASSQTEGHRFAMAPLGCQCGWTVGAIRGLPGAAVVTVAVPVFAACAPSGCLWQQGKPTAISINVNLSA